MTDQPLHIDTAIPGAIAAWYRGDGHGALTLIDAALEQTPPHLLAKELIQYLTLGWLGIIDAADITLDLDDVEAYWNQLALTAATNTTNTLNDTDDGS